MGSDATDEVRQALLALSDLSPKAEQRTAAGTVPLDWFRWLPLDRLPGAFVQAPVLSPGQRVAQSLWNPAQTPSIPPVLVERHFGERLAAIDRLRPDRFSLRVGWLFVAGTTTGDDGRPHHVFLPLVSRPVRVGQTPIFGPLPLVPAGDVELTARIEDRGVRMALEEHIEIGGGALGVSGVAIPEPLLGRLTHLRAFAVKAASAAGWDTTTLIPAGDSPESLRDRDDLVIVAGMAVYANTETGGLSHAASLRAWAAEPLDTWTAFHSLYADAAEAPMPPGDDVDIESPFLLNPAQRSAVRQSRTAPVTVIQGAPGTGKSHTITAIACDSLARGDTVLVAARSDATVDALVELFERAPGPRPVVFGSNERKEALADHLAQGLRPCDDTSLEVARDTLSRAVRHRDRLRQSIADRLGSEALAESPEATDDARVAWPALFEPDTDLEQIGQALAVASAPAHGWRGRRHQRKAASAVERVTGARLPEQRRAVARALDLARATRAAGALEATGGLTIGPDWADLRAADDDVRRVAATWLDRLSHSSDRLTRTSLGGVSALATALRSGRAARRSQLARMDSSVTNALPLWAGTLAEIEDLLPSVAGLFDVVVLDEASSIDQPAAASALLRGKRAVIVGDPKQLRHVSFLSDEQRTQALDGAGIDLSSPLAARLDVRRNSAFDVAASAAPVLDLDEHFRSRPHLVDFVAKRLYADQLRVATRSPATQSVDCIDLRRVQGTRDRHGVVAAEVKAVTALLGQLQTRGASSVGVVTPFRAQAEALEQAVLETVGVAEIDALGLRVGTVHAFQGIERDVVIASMGIGADADGKSWQFVEDPHLFAVLVTRAKDRFVIVHSAEPPPGGLVADYFAHADNPPGPPRTDLPTATWTTKIAGGLADAGLVTSCGYPTGRHLVDICVGTAEGFYGVECGIHPDGPEAHIDRHLALDRRGWPLREAYRSRWDGRIGELIVELATPPDGGG